MSTLLIDLVKSYKLYKLQVTSYKLIVSYKLHVISYELSALLIDLVASPAPTGPQ